jgi:SAM-dependent methyltransferase
MHKQSLVWTFLSRLKKRIKYAGLNQYCPVCKGYIRRFFPHGNPPREHVKCPVCGSLERHRLDWLMFKKNTDLFDGKPKTMLHIAPENFMEVRFKRIKNLNYFSADLNRPNAMVKLDITDISCPDNTFSLIYCSHVLEHVQNDHKAIAEFYRVLKPNGWAVLQVPITTDKTYENPAITEPEDRKKNFGQWDHVRRCGPDYINRMKSAGFITKRLYATDVVNESDCARMGIQLDRLIFFCRKQQPNKSLHETH